ncbi:telomere repeat-binding factor 2-like isoform X1 [Vicia villosa]|uniref:telomere repeat-binding factor 2-like isoform X1 n=1 Tax=Vicia villosa TaxID=3911 RepID=UPI00273B98E7|nr:telomere repeat-binding factor 2-like isoform X1 [Vicia villosa]
MGAPKQKWTAEEEAALKAGVHKHGSGKWRTILTDPDFGAILRTRSNVDLKDKWRNISVTAIWGSRQKAKLALKKNLPAPKIDNNQPALSKVVQREDFLDIKPLTISSGALQSSNLKEQVSRSNTFLNDGNLGDNHVLEAIVNMKDPKGSDKAAIASYIEEKYQCPPDLKMLLSTKLQHMVTSGKIVQEKHKYKIMPSPTVSEKRRSSSLMLIEARPKDSLEVEKSGDVNILSRSQIDEELSKVRSMTAQEAAAAAAKAVAEAEVAIAQAEAAAREAEAAEAEAEAAQVFAKAAKKALKCKMLHI